MGFALPNGATVFVGSEMAAEISVSDVSNAVGFVFTLEAGHGLKVDDVVLISSGWTLMDNAVARGAEQTDTSATISVIDSYDEDYFAPGNGGGYLRKVMSWTEIP